MSDLLIAIQFVCLVLLALGAPIYAVLQLKWRAEASGPQDYTLRHLKRVRRLGCGEVFVDITPEEDEGDLTWQPQPAETGRWDDRPVRGSGLSSTKRRWRANTSCVGRCDAEAQHCG